jgi:hypothetical protein
VKTLKAFLSVRSRIRLQSTRITKTGCCRALNVLAPITSAGLLAFLLSSCATPYQPMGALGGYQEEQLAPNIYRVAFFGNGYTNPQTASEYLIHRCAQLTEQKGYRYFGILAVSDQSVTRTLLHRRTRIQPEQDTPRRSVIQHSGATTGRRITRQRKQSASTSRGRFLRSRCPMTGSKDRTRSSQPQSYRCKCLALNSRRYNQGHHILGPE